MRATARSSGLLFVIALGASACSSHPLGQRDAGSPDGAAAGGGTDASAATGGTGGAGGSAGAAGSGGSAGSGAAGAGGAGGAANGGAGGASCPIVPTGALCTSIPRYTGTQVVDGNGDDFCGVPATVLALKNGVTLDGNAPPPVPDVLTARVAWDAAGIHAHFHVDDAEILSGDEIAFEIGGDFPLAGYFDGVSTDVGLLSIGMGVGTTGTVHGFTATIPPSVSMGFQGRQITCVPSPCTSTPKALVSYGQPLVGPAQWAYRTVSGGYEFELLLPWSVLGRSTPPAPGTVVAADLALYATSSRLSTSSWLAIKPLPSGASTPCPSSTRLINQTPTTFADPNCDDRGWCAPSLE